MANQGVSLRTGQALSVPSARVEAVLKCCGRCRRGMPGFQGPCGYDGSCVCHGVSDD